MLARKDLNWSTPNARLYNEAFTGRAKAIPRCQHCLCEDHASAVCPQNPHLPYVGWIPAPYLANPVQPTPTTSLLATAPQPGPSLGASVRNEICRNFNENRCRFTRCRYLHICTDCHAPHPASMCPRRALPHMAGTPSKGRPPHKSRQALAAPYQAARQ